jgi:SH3 domain protein
MNKKSLFLPYLLLCLLSVATNAATAEVRYVVDRLSITMRSGQSTQHQILRFWPSNTQLELLKSGEKYSRVQGPDGSEGWVLNQYLTAKPTAKLRLAATQAKLISLEKENTRLQTELKTLHSQQGELGTQLKKLHGEDKKQADELTHLQRVAAKPLKLENENQRLKKEVLDLENERELLRQENQMLTDSSDREWFLNGAGVIILGIIIGLITPRLRLRKKSSWGEL